MPDEEEVVPGAAFEAEEPEVDFTELLEDDTIEALDEIIVPETPVLVAEVEAAAAAAAAALALETEAELNSDSLLALLEALILLMASAIVLAAVPLAVSGVAEPARQVVKSRPTLRPVRPSS